MASLLPHDLCHGQSSSRWIWHIYTAAFPKKAHVPSWNSKGYVTHCMTPEVSPDIRPHSRGMLSFLPQVKKSLFSPPQVEMRVDCPASPGKECRRPRRTSRGGWYLLDTGGEPGCLATIRKPRISPSTRDQA